MFFAYPLCLIWIFVLHSFSLMTSPAVSAPTHQIMVRPFSSFILNTLKQYFKCTYWKTMQELILCLLSAMYIYFSFILHVCYCLFFSSICIYLLVFLYFMLIFLYINFLLFPTVIFFSLSLLFFVICVCCFFLSSLFLYTLFWSIITLIQGSSECLPLHGSEYLEIGTDEWPMVVAQTLWYWED